MTPAGDGLPPLDDDRALVARVAGGDRSALEVLYGRHAGWLTVRLQHRCGDPDLVDIAIQDTFLAVWRTAGRYRGTGDVGAWLWGIALRRLIDQLRKRRPVPLDPTVEHPAPPAFGAAATQPSAEAEALATSVGGDLGDAVRWLAPELQAVLVATAVDGLTTREAAVLLGIPHGTVKTRLLRARRQVQERLS